MTGGQLIGVIIGGIVGYAVAATIAGGKYEYLRGNLFLVTEEPMGCIPGCLITLVAVGIGGGLGFVVGSMFGA